MNKQDMYSILNENRINLFQKYCEAESSVDKRLTIKNDGVAYSGMDFIKYVPNEEDRKKQWYPDVVILYWGKNDCGGTSTFGLVDFVISREPKTELGKHVRSVFRVLANVECAVRNVKKLSINKKVVNNG